MRLSLLGSMVFVFALGIFGRPAAVAQDAAPPAQPSPAAAQDTATPPAAAPAADDPAPTTDTPAEPPPAPEADKPDTPPDAASAKKDAEAARAQRIALAREIIGDEAADFVAEPTSEMKLRLAPLVKEDLDEKAAQGLSVLRTAAQAMAEAMIELQRVDGPNADSGQLVELVTHANQVREVKSAIISRVNILLDALEEKGGDVAAGRAYVAVAEKLEPDSTESSDASQQWTPEERAEKALEARVAAAVAAVRDMPPVHERPEPWSISVNELELESQPLPRAVIEERIKKWLQILQREVRERVRLDIALTLTEDDDERLKMADLSGEQQRIILAIVERVEVMLLLFQNRGGDATEYQEYIRHSTGQKINLADMGIFYAQAMAWLRSSEGGVRILFNIIKFLAILVAFWLLSRFVGRIARVAINRVPKASSLLQQFVVGGLQRVIMLIGLVVAVSMLGVNITPLIAAIGAAGLVIGLALQGTLSNFASGILILFYRPFDVGDVINAGGVTGKVDAMNLVSTRILTFDNQLMFVPNNQIWNGVITNITGRETRRVDLVFGIGYGDNIALAQEVIEKAIADHPLTLDDPKPTIKVHELGDNSVNMIVRPWAKTSDYWDVYWDLMRTIKERFDEAGLNIPFPQRDLHVPGPIQVMVSGESFGRGAASQPQVVAAAPAVSGAANEPAPGGEEGEDKEQADD